MKVSDEELASVVRPLLEDSNLSLIPYARFLELFSSPRYIIVIILSFLSANVNLDMFQQT